jgi:alpha-D-ribose 1-methylphosphonate 5-phosphate C-P lyase
LLRVIRKVKDTERKKINTLCHQISHAIVEQAKANNAIIVYRVVLFSEPKCRFVEPLCYLKIYIIISHFV